MRIGKGGMSQLRVWEGEFGKAYTDRNVVDWEKRVDGFRQMVGALPIHRVLEVGCNRGHNLRALLEILGAGAELVGVEPNEYALEIARSVSNKITVLPATAQDLPFQDGEFDLTFTAGVLIHVALPDLGEVMREMARVSRRYILAVEYFAEQETVISYRGHNDLLWKRNFLQHYRDNVPGLRVIGSGHVGQEAGFDNAHWWLLGKESAIQ